LSLHVAQPGTPVNTRTMRPDFLSIGHITHDRAPEGFLLGGTVTYASATAKQLGRSPAILTAGSLAGLAYSPAPGGPAGAVRLDGGELDGVIVKAAPSPATTTFANIYSGGHRTQIIEAIAAPILPEHLPAEWAGAPIVLLGPLVQELSPAWAEMFPDSLLGVTPQGWMRAWDEAGHVRPTRWENAGPILRRADAVILSREDVGGDEAYIADLAQQTQLLVVTDGYHGATVYRGDQSDYVPARPTEEVDPTGAGDVFAASFMIGLAETGDPLAATRFAHIVASMSIEATGLASIPPRSRVDAWLTHQAHRP
jgi:sugar/nucleoside kinase (ribokinase family)